MKYTSIFVVVCMTVCVTRLSICTVPHICHAYRWWDHKARKWYYHSIQGEEVDGHSGAVAAVVLNIQSCICDMFLAWCGFLLLVLERT